MQNEKSDKTPICAMICFTVIIETILIGTVLLVLFGH